MSAIAREPFISIMAYRAKLKENKIIQNYSGSERTGNGYFHLIC